MSLTAYFQTIEGIDPGKIYVENVRSILGTTRFLAKFACEMAVRDNIFEKKVGLLCPHCGRILYSFGKNEKIPELISCELCEAEDQETSTYQTSSLKRITFYKLK